MTRYPALVQAVVEGDYQKAVRLTYRALEQDAGPEDIVAAGLQAAMAVVGEKFTSGEFFVPDMLLAARAATKAMDVVRPHLSSGAVATLGKVVIGTVAGDIHDIGKNLVIMFLQGAGFEVIDLGTDVSEDRFVAAVREYKPDVIGMSSLLTTTMPAMGNTIGALVRAELRHSVKIAVGGAPVTERFATQIGADAYAPDGGAAITVCRRLIGK